MSKPGRRRRTPEQRIADRDNRSTLGYLQRIQREAENEQREREFAAIFGDVADEPEEKK